jgi:hypothetical protein
MAPVRSSSVSHSLGRTWPFDFRSDEWPLSALKRHPRAARDGQLATPIADLDRTSARGPLGLGSRPSSGIARGAHVAVEASGGCVAGNHAGAALPGLRTATAGGDRTGHRSGLTMKTIPSAVHARTSYQEARGHSALRRRKRALPGANQEAATGPRRPGHAVRNFPKSPRTPGLLKPTQSTQIGRSLYPTMAGHAPQETLIFDEITSALIVINK